MTAIYCRPKNKFDKQRKIIIRTMKKHFSTLVVKIIYHWKNNSQYG